MRRTWTITTTRLRRDAVAARSSGCRTGSRSRRRSSRCCRPRRRSPPRSQDLIAAGGAGVFRRAARAGQRGALRRPEARDLRAARAGQAQFRGRHRDDRRHARGPGALRPGGRQGDLRQERPRGEAPRAAAADRQAPGRASRRCGDRSTLDAPHARRHRGVGEDRQRVELHGRSSRAPRTRSRAQEVDRQRRRATYRRSI